MSFKYVSRVSVSVLILGLVAAGTPAVAIEFQVPLPPTGTTQITGSQTTTIGPGTLEHFYETRFAGLDLCPSISLQNSQLSGSMAPCFPQLRYMKVFPGTHVTGSLEGLLGGSARVGFNSVQNRTTGCFVAFSLGFDVPEPLLVGELSLDLGSVIGDSALAVALFDPKSDDVALLGCVTENQSSAGDTLKCALPPSMVVAHTDRRQQIEIFFMIDVQCGFLSGVAKDAVAVKKVRLGPPPPPPP